jgi:hypothetical protein
MRRHAKGDDVVPSPEKDARNSPEILLVALSTAPVICADLILDRFRRNIWLAGMIFVEPLFQGKRLLSDAHFCQTGSMATFRAASRGYVESLSWPR